jgi:hypothetical protein
MLCDREDRVRHQNLAQEHVVRRDIREAPFLECDCQKMSEIKLHFGKKYGLITFRSVVVSSSCPYGDAGQERSRKAKHYI